MGLGLVGCGGASIDVVRALANSSIARVVAVHDLDLVRAADVAAATGARMHPRLGSLLADPAVEAIYIALPHDLLVATTLKALHAGRHVLSEKPLATNAAGIRRVREAMRTSGLSVGILLEQRAVPSVAAATTLVQGGAIGTPRLIQIRTRIDKPAAYWDSGPTGLVPSRWRASRRRAGGGVILMNTIHQLDAVRAITGLEVIRVSADVDLGVPGVEVEDVGVAVLRFAGGALGTLVASAHAPGVTDGEVIAIDGSDGSIELPDPYRSPARLRLFLRRSWGGHDAGKWLDLCLKAENPWAVIVERFADAVSHGQAPIPGIDEAEAALATVLAIYRSARSRRTVAVRRSFDQERDSRRLAQDLRKSNDSEERDRD